MDNGWIKLSRGLQRWRWYKDPETLLVFINLLLSANHQDNEVGEITVKRGQLITSVKSICEDTGLTTKVVRNRLERLEKTGEVRLQGANKFTMITICNYDNYQNAEEERGKQGANKGQTKTEKRANKNENLIIYEHDSYEPENSQKGKQGANKNFEKPEKRATNKNIRNKEYIITTTTARAREEDEEKGENNFLEDEGVETSNVNTSQEGEEKEKSCAKKEKEEELPSFEQVQQHNGKLVEAMKQNNGWTEQIAFVNKISQQKLQELLTEFEMQCNVGYKELAPSDMHAHFRSWLKQELRHQQRATKATVRRNNTAQRREMQKRVNERWEGKDSSKYAQADEYQRLLEELNQGKKKQPIKIPNIRNG